MALYIRVFPILDYIPLIKWISWIQLEPVECEWELLKVFLCLPLTVGALV